MSIRIIIGGPPNSGKSTFAERLARALQNLGLDAQNIELDLWAPTRDYVRGDITMEERNRRKNKTITKKEAVEAGQRFKEFSTKHDIIIGDAPGRITDESKEIFQYATHGIIVCKEDERKNIETWRGFFNENRIQLIAIVISKMDGEETVSSTEIIESTLVKLDRQPTITAGIMAIATLLRTKFGM